MSAIHQFDNLGQTEPISLDTDTALRRIAL